MQGRHVVGVNVHKGKTFRALSANVFRIRSGNKEINTWIGKSPGGIVRG